MKTSLERFFFPALGKEEFMTTGICLMELLYNALAQIMATGKVPGRRERAK